MNRLTFNVYGLPAAQGSKRHVGHGVMVESSKRVEPWRQDVKAAALTAIVADGWVTLTGPCALVGSFWLPRPKRHYRANGQLRPDAPEFVATTPDLDKALRSTFDALTAAGVWVDDKQVVRVHVVKRYASGAPGATFTIREVTA